MPPQPFYSTFNGGNPGRNPDMYKVRNTVASLSEREALPC